MTVTASVSTKGRYFTTLPLVVEAIALQTVRPKQLVIFDDNTEMKDLRQVSPYSHLFPLLMSKGIQWFHLPGQRIGQVANHQTALDRADTDFVLRLDDDNAPEPTCLENLLKGMDDPTVGAVGGLVHDPKAVSQRPSFVTGKIDEILNPFNLQWYDWKGPPEEVDHLYSTFLYRVQAAKKAGGYSKLLSPVGHREETMFSHEIKRAGYKLLVTPDALTWHFREGTGGIRSYTDGSLWARDEQVFLGKLKEWGVSPKEYKVVVLDNGLGDHFMMKAILPQLIAQNHGKRIIVANCYQDVFKDTEGITTASIADAKAAFGNLDQWDIYRWGEERQWKGPLVEAFKQMYGVVNTGLQG
jgi:hypothetical protein